MWKEGTINGYKWWAKVLDDCSDFGIHSGCVIKLTVRDSDGKEVINYDRGWDIYPQTQEHVDIMVEVLAMFDAPQTHGVE